MRRFRVTVNGVSYDVGVEEIPTDGIPAASRGPALPATHEIAPIVRPAIVPAPPAVIQPVLPDSGEAASEPGMVEAPLPGAILAVKVAPGDQVAPGQVLILLEAMKMENEVVAPISGRVAEVRVKPGDSVALGDLLCVLMDG